MVTSPALHTKSTSSLAVLEIPTSGSATGSVVAPPVDTLLEELRDARASAAAPIVTSGWMTSRQRLAMSRNQLELVEDFLLIILVVVPPLLLTSLAIVMGSL